MKIYLSPSNQPDNKYSCSNTNEKAQMEDLTRSLIVHLSKYENIDTVLATLSSDIGKRPSEARAAGCDLYLAIHSNAGGTTAKGPVALYHPKQPSVKLFGEFLCKRLAEASPYGTNRKTPVYSGMDAFNGVGFAEIREPEKLGMRTLLLEVDFHSNFSTCQYIMANKDLIAKTIAQAIADYYNLPKKIEKPTEDGYIYRVQVGAFRMSKNAEELAEKLRNDGYPVYIRKEKM